MKQLAALLLLLLGQAFGACTPTNSGANGATAVCTSASSCTVSYTATAGKFLSLYTVEYNSNTDRYISVVDNNGSPLAQDSAVGAALAATLEMQFWSYVVPGGGATSFTINSLDSANFIVSVSEFSCTGAVSLDVKATTQNLTGATPWFASSITTTGASGFVIGGAFNAFGPNPAGTGSWTLSSAGHDGSNTFFGGVVYQITSSAGAYQPSGTSVGNNNTTALSISYKEAGGGGNPAQHNLLTLGVGIAKLDPDTYLPLLGVGEAIVAGLPPINSRGENDGLRQDNAVVSSVDALVRNSLLARDEHDDGVYSDAKIFALLYVHSANKFDLMGFSSPLVDWTQMVLRADSLNGVVDWKKVGADLSDLVNFAAFSHWFDPRKATAEQMKSFLVDFAHIVDAYNRAE